MTYIYILFRSLFWLKQLKSAGDFYLDLEAPVHQSPSMPSARLFQKVMDIVKAWWLSSLLSFQVNGQYALTDDCSRYDLLLQYCSKYVSISRHQSMTFLTPYPSQERGYVHPHMNMMVWISNIYTQMRRVSMRSIEGSMLTSRSARGLLCPVMPRDTMPQRTWSRGQARLLGLVREGIKADDANPGVNQDAYSLVMFVSGEPGAGKSQAVVHAVREAAMAGANVLITCPTGMLVSGCLDRLPVEPMMESISVQMLRD